MRVIRPHLPALDAALIRFDLVERPQPRERMMLGVLGALLLAAVLVFGVIKPLQSARAEALADIRTYETLTARIRAAGTLGAVDTEAARARPRQVVSSSATALRPGRDARGDSRAASAPRSPMPPTIADGLARRS
jgi:general secretion pathway protein M